MSIGPVPCKAVMAKGTSHHKINYEKGILDGTLQLVRQSFLAESSQNLELADAWVIVLEHQQIQPFLKVVNTVVEEEDPIKFEHFKRLRKSSTGEIEAILCSARYLPDEGSVIAFLAKFMATGVPQIKNRVPLPNVGPRTKVESQVWSTDFWPTTWKGNVDHQMLVTAKFDLELERSILMSLLAHIKATSGVQIGTTIAEVDRSSGQLRPVCTAMDNRETNHLEHSVMRAIAKIAEEALRRRQEANEFESYLCHNMVVFTLHEPCSMCAMALVHSRIGRLVYLKSHPKGGIESSHFIGVRNDLNWTFEVWKWVGQLSETEDFSLSPEVFP